MGIVDSYGNYIVELPDHHIYIEERGFFSKMLLGDKFKQEKDALVEAFSKDIFINSIIRNRERNI